MRFWVVSESITSAGEYQLNWWTEMTCMSGKVLLNKRGHQVAYCAQNPCQFSSGVYAAGAIEHYA